MPLYLPGLSPTLSFASLSVKPTLLSLFESFILGVDPISLRPALKAIVLALLPGLEEETSEEFDRTYNILSKLKSISGQGYGHENNIGNISKGQYFWQCLFLASITSPSRRQGALSYLVRDLPNLGAPVSGPGQKGQKESNDSREEHLSPAMEAVASPEPGLLIRCFAAGLRDEQLLIQRGFLDLLVTHLPLHSAVLQVKVTPADRERLIAAAVSVVARREMSLNRRLWSWFLGPDLTVQRRDSAPHSPDYVDDNQRIHLKRVQPDYFERYGLDALVSSIKKMLINDSLTAAEKARPFRICLSLMDRWEIGGLVVPHIFLAALESVWRYHKATASKESSIEVLRSANVFFDGVESGLIWGEINKMLLLALQVDESAILVANDRLDLALFIITKFNIREDEMLHVHIPIAAVHLLVCLRSRQCQPLIWSNVMYGDIYRKALTVCSHLVELIPEKAFAIEHSKENPKVLWAPESDGPRHMEILDAIALFYRQQGSLDASQRPMSAKDMGGFLLQNATQMVIQDLGCMERVTCVEIELSILEKLIRKIHNLEAINWEKALSIIVESSKSRSAKIKYPLPFQSISTIISALEIIKLAMPIKTWQADYRVRKIIPDLINNIWPHLSPSTPQYNVEAARCILRIQRVSPEKQLIEGSITSLMVCGETANRISGTDVEAARRFITLWAHSVSTINGSLDRRWSPQYRAESKNRTTDQALNDTIILARPLLLLLDSLFEPKSEMYLFISSWIGSLPNLQM